jgi:iron complex outermembrane recepter protein
MDRFKQRERQLDAAGTPWQVNRHLRALQQSLYAYLGAQLSPVTTLSLFPSLRLASFIFHVDDRQNGKGTDHFETLIPRIAARFDPHQRVALFASWGRGYRSPEARAVTAQPVEEIEDERLSRYVGGRAEVAVVDGFEAGIETSPIDILTLSLVGFASLLDTEMVFDHVSNLNVAMDGTRRFGATLRGAVAPFEWLSLAGDVTFTDARFNHSKNRVPGVPIWMGTARADIGRRRGPKGGLSALVVGRRPLQHNASVNGYVDLGITAGWRFERVDVTAMIENVANQKIMEGAYHFASWFDETEARSALPSIHYAAGEPLTVRLLATVYL